MIAASNLSPHSPTGLNLVDLHSDIQKTFLDKLPFHDLQIYGQVCKKTHALVAPLLLERTPTIKNLAELAGITVRSIYSGRNPYLRHWLTKDLVLLLLKIHQVKLAQANTKTLNESYKDDIPLLETLRKEIAGQQVRMGYLSEAKKGVEKFYSDETRAGYLISVAEAQAELKNYTGANAALDEIPLPPQGPSNPALLRSLAAARAKARNFTSAAALVEQIQRPNIKALALADIAEARAKNGDDPEAKMAFKAALALAKPTKYNCGPSRFIINKLIRAGYFTEAREAIPLSLSNFRSDRDFLYHKLACALQASGDKEGAAKLNDSIELEHNKFRIEDIPKKPKAFREDWLPPKLIILLPNQENFEIAMGLATTPCSWKEKYVLCKMLSTTYLRAGQLELGMKAFELLEDPPLKAALAVEIFKEYVTGEVADMTNGYCES